MNIHGKITGIKYKKTLLENLEKINISEFDINKVPTSCIVEDNKNTFAVSKWVSPKRTRSYPFARVFNTLNISKKITVIPVIKDEGKSGDRDFLQWDTISLMSLLDVYVIFAYYSKAEKKNQKITNQKFDNDYVLSKINEIEQYHSSALHWNLNELKFNLHNILDKIKNSYQEIEKTTRIKLHDFSGIDNFKNKIGEDVSLFMEFSREKSEKAQSREYITLQPKENLSTLSKAKVTISNFLEGVYFLTVDEVLLSQDKLYLIEGKHSCNSVLPSKDDIKDGLLKMILYSNLVEVTVDNKNVNTQAVLCLTSSKLKGSITSLSKSEEQRYFFSNNSFSTKQIDLLNSIIKEANENGFLIKVQFQNDKKPIEISRRKK